MSEKISYNSYANRKIPMVEDSIQKVQQTKIEPEKASDDFRKKVEEQEYRMYLEGLKTQGLTPNLLVVNDEDSYQKYHSILSEFGFEEYITFPKPDSEAAFMGLAYTGPVLIDANDTNALHKMAEVAKLGQMSQMRYITCNLNEIYFKLNALAKNASYAGYSGMSDAEKYKAVYDRYAKEFGSDFLLSTSVRYGYTAAIDPGKIVKQFENELEMVIGNYDKVTSACRIAQYGDMSDSQVRNAISAKYPPLGKITLREFHCLLYELESVGVSGGLNRVLDRAIEDSMRTDIMVREELLDKPLDFQWLSKTYSTMNNAMAKTSYNDVGSSYQVMLDLFGTSFR